MTQSDAILKHLKRRGTITPLVALRRYGCFRLAARIYDLRDEGHLIDTETTRFDGKQFAMYRYKRR